MFEMKMGLWSENGKVLLRKLVLRMGEMQEA
jgi:hypothetical protein